MSLSAIETPEGQTTEGGVAPFAVHDARWTRERVDRFWNIVARTPGETAYAFSRGVGAAIVDLLERRGVLLASPVVDYGCGSGHLIDLLLEYGLECWGVERIPGLIAMASRRLAGKPNFKGVVSCRRLPTQLRSAASATVFLVEVVEHLLKTELLSTTREIFRVLRRGGHLVVVTPNQEDLERNYRLCPECGCRFHPKQHLQSWSAMTLAAHFEAAGFNTVDCLEVTLRAPSRLNWARRLIGRFHSRVRPAHLLYVGRK